MEVNDHPNQNTGENTLMVLFSITDRVILTPNSKSEQVEEAFIAEKNF